MEEQREIYSVTSALIRSDTSSHSLRNYDLNSLDTYPLLPMTLFAMMALPAFSQYMKYNVFKLYPVCRSL